MQSNTITILDRPWGSQIYRYSAYEGGKVVSPTHRPPLPPQEIFLVLISDRGWVDPRGHSAAGKIMSMKNSSDTIGNRTRDLPACSVVPNPTAPSSSPTCFEQIFLNILWSISHFQKTNNYSPLEIRKQNGCQLKIAVGKPLVNRRDI
jgi:hypothetical protein